METQVSFPAPAFPPPHRQDFLAPWPPVEKPCPPPPQERWALLRRTLKQELQSSARIILRSFPQSPRGCFWTEIKRKDGCCGVCAPAQRLRPTPFPELSQDLLLFSVCFLQPGAKPSINDPASAPSPAKWVPDAPWRPCTKCGRKTLLRQISRENTIRQSKQSWRGR